MGSRRLLGYGDAVVLLGGDPAGLAALDEALGGVLSVATGGVSQTVLDLAGAQGRILRIGRDITGRLRESLGSVDRADRSRLLEAAHAVLVVTAFFEVASEARLPFDWSEVQLTRREQVLLASGGDPVSDRLIEVLSASGLPVPARHMPYEEVLIQLGGWYAQLGARLQGFLLGLAIWERMAPADREAAGQVLADLALPAVTRYEELYARLATEVPEFGFWNSRIEHQATRATVRRALAGVESLLAGLSAAAAPVDVAAALSAAHRAALDRPILAEGDVPTGVQLPAVAAGYLDPRFRVRALGGPGPGGPAEEEWWEDAEPRDDLSEFLAGALTGPQAAGAPLVVLGQPGAGKSMLTRVLAARLPAAGFLPVRVVLRDVPAEAEVQDQIEHAVRSATGERASWPDLVRAAPGLVPVVLFDGFDELLQATGVSQSDFLMRVAAFQQRESDQGRTVITLVTTRTAVADRARYPAGSVALRLEGFDEQQVNAWLEMWNRTNAPYFAASGRRPLAAGTARRHRELASQPLLLLMLALYDATENALQQDGAPLEEADLYENLLTAFAAREVGKGAVAARPDQLADRVQQELERLSLVAFAMLNRRRQWVTSAELDTDLGALLGRPAAAESGFRAPLDQAEIALGRFFFVQRAQAVQDERRLATYEFLHATFGEYLAVRLAVDLLHQMLDVRPALRSGPVAVDDGLLYALLSYVPLSSRQMLRFVGARTGRIAPPDRARLADLVVQVVAAGALRTQHDHAEYRPDVRPTSARHGTYEANLVLLLLALTGTLTASRLFPESDDPPGTWHRRALLWRSSFTEPEWTDFALALRLRHTWAGERRELEIELGDGAAERPEPADPYWLYGYAPDSPRPIAWTRSYAEDVRRKMDVSGGTNDSVVAHAMEPVFDLLGPQLLEFSGYGHGRATSLAHDLLEILLIGRVAPHRADLLETAYQHVPKWFGPWRGVSVRASEVVLGLLAEDARWLPPDAVANVLARLDEVLDVAELSDDRVLSAALTALDARPAERDRDVLLTFVLRASQAHWVREGRRWIPDGNRAWHAWVALHDHGLGAAIYGADARQMLRDGDVAALPPTLRRDVRRVAAAYYPDVRPDIGPPDDYRLDGSLADDRAPDELFPERADPGSPNGRHPDISAPDGEPGR
ncbi:MAG: hypothetical protein HOY69_08715 [Streptomyces sp.]|nr:hypothetical protein [Streptomyces sp.]